MGCEGNGAFSRICLRIRSRSGQGTLEYALVVFAVMAMLGGMGALWHLVQSGSPVQHAILDASHHVASLSPGAIADTFLY